MQMQVFLLTSVEMSRPSSVIAGTVPECLLPVANREVLDIQLEALEKCGAWRGTRQ
jgi:NDP-sugar pyrophosphorylase family protein